MKHGSTFRKLGRDSAHRWAMMRTMVTQLIEHERIQTTVAKAKELRKIADRVVTYAKRGTLSARRRATAVVRTDAAVQKLFTELAERYSGRAGGFTRVLQTGQRSSDSAQMAYIEYVDREGELRPARPAQGLGLSWAAKEFVERRISEQKREKTGGGKTATGKETGAQMAYIEYVDREGELRPARPAQGLGLSWAAKEFVERRISEQKREKTGGGKTATGKETGGEVDKEVETP